MTPSIANSLALIYYTLFWGAIVWMINTTLIHMLGIGFSSLVFVVLVGLCLSCMTVFVSNLGRI